MALPTVDFPAFFQIVGYTPGEKILVLLAHVLDCLLLPTFDLSSPLPRARLLYCLELFRPMRHVLQHGRYREPDETSQT